jgi:hypothetical protein
MKKPYELCFWGAGTVRSYKIPRHRRQHPSLASAREEARTVHALMEAQGLPTAAHPAIVHGPQLGADGFRVS